MMSVEAFLRHALELTLPGRFNEESEHVKPVTPCERLSAPHHFGDRPGKHLKAIMGGG
jgi:hypothetical protein